MPLRIVNQLSLLLTGAVLATLLVLGGLAAWNLRSGFSQYLRLQDEAWLERFAALAGAAVERDGLGAISGGRGTLRPLLERLRSENPPEGPGPSRSGPPPNAPWPGPSATDGSVAGVAPPRPGPPGGDPRRYGQRLMLVTPAGVWLSGRPERAAGLVADPVAERPVIAHGSVVALAQLREGPPVPNDLDAAFLARQYRGLLFTAVGALAVALALALWLAWRWGRPVLAAQAAARRIAAGAFDVRIAPVHGSLEMRALAEDINAMAAALEGLEASRRRWIAELSHELRTPLSVLRAEVEALQDGVRRPDAAALRSLHDEVQRLARLADDFHDLAMSDLRRLPMRPTELDPLALVEAVVQRLAERAQALGLTLELSGLERLPPMCATWDGDRITQLLTNLLHNSLHYTDAPGRVQVRVAQRAESLPDGPRPGLRLTVDDSPPGVPAAELPRLFEPLYRADPARRRGPGGSGLGLAICRAIVDGHGGRIGATASELGGLCVDLWLPLDPTGADR